MVPDPRSTVTLCGHAEYAKGECAVPGCANSWQACPECGPAGGAEMPSNGAGNDCIRDAGAHGHQGVG